MPKRNTYYSGGNFYGNHEVNLKCLMNTGKKTVEPGELSNTLNRNILYFPNSSSALAAKNSSGRQTRVQWATRFVLSSL